MPQLTPVLGPQEEQRRWVAVLTSAQHLPEASTLPAPTVSPSGLYPSIDGVIPGGGGLEQKIMFWEDLCTIFC